MKIDKVVIPQFGQTAKAFDLQAVSEFVTLLKAGKIEGFILAYKEKEGDSWDHVITHRNLNEEKDAPTLNLLLDCMKHDLLTLETRRCTTVELQDDGS